MTFGDVEDILLRERVVFEDMLACLRMVSISSSTFAMSSSSPSTRSTLPLATIRVLGYNDLIICKCPLLTP